MICALGERILQAAERGGFTQTALETALVELNVTTKGYMSRIVYGERSPSIELVSRMAKLCGVEFNWLATGEGPITRPETTPTPPSHTVIRKLKPKG